MYMYFYLMHEDNYCSNKYKMYLYLFDDIIHIMPLICMRVCVFKISYTNINIHICLCTEQGKQRKG
ncbi:uncharacterized protein BX663DRAFT_513459 [Cokeromyces recurvatus]|uniref:uncharacterized protein n=1 Tax=Cokeromyces recurvatus TaxID=90255 RepID=UPI00221FEF00|nr:uncharacterized protein BX663DRAFT_513459 [Cokeromyces recurvatus]KAI7901619.1 hypothetical protein BX663DRAFT_513459 [Cokeromyces recurvatus]